MRCKGGKLCVKLRHWYYDFSKKSIVKIIEKLGLGISAKSFGKNVRKFYKEANRAKGDVLFRIGFFIDRRKNVYMTIDYTPDIRYGKNVFAAAYQHNNTFNARLWQNTIVNCAVFHNGAYINNYFEVYVTKDYIERTKGKDREGIEMGMKIEIAIKIVKEAVAWLLSLVFSKVRIHILNDSWYLKFFRFKEENEKAEYIATTKLDVLPKSAYRHKKKEWKVEGMHEYLKGYFGLEECYSGKGETYGRLVMHISQYAICYS